MTFKIVLTSHLPGLDYGEGLLKSMDAELTRGLWFTEDELIENTRDADAVICSGPSQPWNPRVIGSLSKCRILASLSFGFDRIHLGTAGRQGIVVTNVPDFCIEEVSSQAMALIMALGRKLLHIDRAVRERQVHIPPIARQTLAELLHPIFRLTEQTVGIIGFGKIGTALALKAKGVGMRVIAYDPYVLEGVMLSHGVEPVDLDSLLKNSDFVSINADLNDETRHMINRDALKKMKPTSYIVNTARGGIVDEPALIEALRNGEIAGAGLDATSEEPMKPDNPLLGMRNVILTGHSAWYSTTSDSGPGYWQKAMVQVILALKGKWPPYAVNPQVKDPWLKKWGA